MVPRLFIADPSLELKRALADTLVDLDLGVCVASASTQREATDWLQGHPQGWDVLVVEPRLREGNGLALIEMALQLAPRRPVLVLTHFATEAMNQYCLDQGAEAVFDKATQMVAFIGHLQRLRSAYLAQRPL